MDEAQRSEWKIVELTIEGFRRFQRRHTWQFRAPDGSPLDVIIFAGPSGSGKTSALEALLIALGEQSSDVMAGACVTLVLERWRMAGQDYEEVEARREVIWRGDAKQPVFFRDKAVDYFSSWRAPERVGGVRPKTKGAPKKKSEANRLFLIKEHIVSSLARSAIVKGSHSSAGQDALNTLNGLWARFAPASFSTRAKIEAGDAARSNDGYDLFVVDGDKRISVDDLSAGELELLQLAGSFAFGLSAPRALLIVDEPELHLDQALQSAWLGVVREATGCATQLILATHSEEIWSRAYSYERFLLVDAEDPRAQLQAARGGIRS